MGRVTGEHKAGMDVVRLMEIQASTHDTISSPLARIIVVVSWTIYYDSL